MGGSESKATVLERTIQKFKTGLGGDNGVKMKRSVRSNGPLWGRVAPREHPEPKHSGNSLCRRAGTPGSMSAY